MPVRGGAWLTSVRIAIALAFLAVFVQGASAESGHPLEPYQPSAVNLILAGGTFREGNVHRNRAKRFLDSPPIAYRTPTG